MRRRLATGILSALLYWQAADGAVLYGLKSTTAPGGSGPPTLLFQANPDGSRWSTSAP